MDPIDMIYLHGQGLAQPLGKTALLAAILEQSNPKQAALYVRPAFCGC
jgi:hypothetical protein